MVIRSPSCGSDHCLVNSKILSPYVKSTGENKEKLETLEIRSTARYGAKTKERIGCISGREEFN